jgi:RNA polymerase sigma-70 factor (ECF subfamily)
LEVEHRCWNVNAVQEAVANTRVQASPFDFEAAFRGHYVRISRVIARVVRDPARAEELAVEVFWKLWQNPRAQTPQSAGWLYRAAVRAGLDELRKQARREKYERWFGRARAAPPDPEQLRASVEEQDRVRAVLKSLSSRHAEILVLRSEGCDYQAIADAAGVNASSVGTLLIRAQEAFRKEYLRRYGKD